MHFSPYLSSVLCWDSFSIFWSNFSAEKNYWKQFKKKMPAMLLSPLTLSLIRFFLRFFKTNIEETEKVKDKNYPRCSPHPFSIITKEFLMTLSPFLWWDSFSKNFGAIFSWFFCCWKNWGILIFFHSEGGIILNESLLFLICLSQNSILGWLCWTSVKAFSV